MPGRNESCPCGSGRKFKHCCLKAHEQADFLWRQLRAAEGKFVPELLQLALRECGPQLLAAALDAFFLWDGVPEGYTETEAFSSFFVPWFVYEFIDDPHAPDRVSNAPDEPLARLYLRRHRQQLSATEQAFLEAASASPLSFYAVTRVEPGRDMALHDVLTGSDVVVHERSASTMVPAGALLFTRVVTVDRTSIMSGCAPLVIPPAWHLRLLDARDQLTRGKRRVLTRDMVRDRDIELRELYFAIEDQVRNPPLPQLRNTDGDRLVPTTLVYRLRCSPSTAFERLKPLARATTGDVTQLLSEAQLDGAGELASVTIPWSKKGNRLHREWDNTTLGTLAIEGDRLQVDVNSNRRARRVEREIAKRLGGDVVLESRTATPIETLLDERRKSPRDTIDALAQERLEQQPEVQEFLRQQSERHWETWLDTPLPALGTLTPRQAARTLAGRERLEALFAEFTWMTGQAPHAMAPDVPALRAKLGLR